MFLRLDDAGVGVKGTFAAVCPSWGLWMVVRGEVVGGLCAEDAPLAPRDALVAGPGGAARSGTRFCTE